MKILIVLPFIPLERNCGGNQAVINFLEYMRGRCELTLTFPVRRHNRRDADRLASNWPDVKVRPYRYWEDGESVSRRKSVSLDPSDVIRDNTHLMVNDVLLNTDIPFFRFILRLLEEEKYDIVQTEFVDFIKLSYYLPSDVRKIFVHHEIMFVRNENELSLFPDRTPVDDALIQCARDVEIAALRRYDDVIVLTGHDKEILDPLLPGTAVHCSPAAIPQRKPCGFRQCGKDFVFVGGMSHHPNLDGVLWFAKYVVPQLRKRADGVRIHIVGNWDRKYVKLISKACPEIRFEGFVDDMGAFMNGKISIVPIRIGSGMRMKILDAVNSMSPFVTTTKGVEGQDFENGRECLVADTPEDFAEAMLRAASDVTLQRTLSENAAEKLKRDCDSTDVLGRRMEIYGQILS